MPTSELAAWATGRPLGMACTPLTLAPRLASLFSNRSVLDVGAGLGQYGVYFTKHSAAQNISWVGVDGAENVENATGGRVHFADLTEAVPAWLAARRFDWVMSVTKRSGSNTGRRAAPCRANDAAPPCRVASAAPRRAQIEVAEHIPRLSEPTLAHWLGSIAREGLLLSWARLGQRGHRHVNCQRAGYVTCALELLGWRHDAELSAELRSRVNMRGHSLTKDCNWLNSTLFAFRRAGACPAASPAALCPVPAYPTPAFRAAYLQHTSSRCPFVPGSHNDDTRGSGCDPKLHKYDEHTE